MRKAVFLPPNRSAGQNNLSCIFTTKLTGDTTFERDLHLLVALPHVELCRPTSQLEHLHTYTVCYERTYRRLDKKGVLTTWRLEEADIDIWVFCFLGVLFWICSSVAGRGFDGLDKVKRAFGPKGEQSESARLEESKATAATSTATSREAMLPKTRPAPKTTGRLQER